ncbi:hypothetical protein AYI84_18880 [Shewanella algae]|uniref:hypothetical protein n=1 Tax=Shewanella algae TaxID=38313 RepID=UPI0011834E58|nr:hypothetical protein [Shewanella algae]TVK99349.1 hypothetical protein AYI84_18880 [Shewanella algae]TVL47876.1 hypothetical protein AYI99_10750 [Shewanella algae]TVL62841.1 hypothetical protein AYJ00_10890 [Shewanella algae]
MTTTNTNTQNTQQAIIEALRADTSLYRAVGFYLRYVMPGDPVEGLPEDWKVLEHHYGEPDYEQNFKAGDLAGVLVSHVDHLVVAPETLEESRINLVSSAINGWIGLFDVEPLIHFIPFIELVLAEDVDVKLIKIIDEQVPEGVTVEQVLAQVDSTIEKVERIRGNHGYMRLHPDTIKLT